MKLKFLIIVLLTNASVVFSQAKKTTTCQNDLTTCKTENEKLKQENDYLKKSLNVLTPLKSLTQDEVEFKITKCEGNIKEQTIIITFYLTNHKANSSFRMDDAQTIDVQGKDFNTYEISLGNKGNSNNLYTDTPLESKIKFYKVLPSIKILKLLSVNQSPYSLGILKTGNFEFRDLEITWK